MNIFYLDQDQRLAAQYHVDRHVCKMILEQAQLLCTAVNVLAGKQVTPYKSTHVNHPCGVWTRETYYNFRWLFDLTVQLNKEYCHRYNKYHKSFKMLVDVDIMQLGKDLLPEGSFTAPALAMPDHCKISSDPVECYREYYRKEKVGLHKWTNRDKPSWI